MISPIVEIFQVPSDPKVRRFLAANIRRFSCSGFGHYKKTVLVEAEHLQRGRIVMFRKTNTNQKTAKHSTCQKCGPTAESSAQKH